MRHFSDNSIAPIIAIDFDDTICVGNSYPDPHNGQLRPFAKEVINLMYNMGIKIVIWTNRKNVKGTDIKDKLLMKQWLDEMGILYHTVNDSTEFAPFKYYGRKLYAHMFVDDRGFGFNCYDNFIMIKVLRDFLEDIVGCYHIIVNHIIIDVMHGMEPNIEDIEYVKEVIRQWEGRVMPNA